MTVPVLAVFAPDQGLRPSRTAPLGCPRVCFRKMAGLTLLELLIAMTVLTTLGLLTYRATSAAIATYTHLQASEQRWSEVVRAVHIIETELLQVVHAGRVELSWQPRTAVSTGSDDPVLARLSVLSLGAPRGPERIAFMLQGTTLYWVREASARSSAATLQQDVLLDDVEALEWQLLGRDGWVTEWNRAQTPTAIRLSFTVQGHGEFSRLIPLF